MDELFPLLPALDSFLFVQFVCTGKVQPGPAHLSCVVTDRPGLQQRADMVSEETSVLLPWRQHQCPRDL